MKEFVKLNTENGIGTIEFFHPQSNSLPGHILAELANTITTTGEDENIKVIILKSAGERAFCAGASFDELVAIDNEIDGKQFSAGGGILYGFNWLSSYHLNGTIPIPIIGKTGFAIQQLETKYNGTILSMEQTISFAQGFDLQHDKNSRLSIGYTANFIQWDLGRSAGISGDGSDGLDLGTINAVTIDLGVLASLREKYRFGVYLKNINAGALGKGMTRQVLPRRINAGITYMPISELSTSIVSETLLGRDDLQIKYALRYKLNSFLEIYAGSQSNPNRLGLGITLQFNKFIVSGLGNHYTFSYGLLTHPILPMTHQFKIGISI